MMATARDHSWIETRIFSEAAKTGEKTWGIFFADGEQHEGNTRTRPPYNTLITDQRFRARLCRSTAKLTFPWCPIEGWYPATAPMCPKGPKALKNSDLIICDGWNYRNLARLRDEGAELIVALPGAICTRPRSKQVN